VKRRAPVVLIAVLSLLALALAGCGSGSSTSSAGSAPSAATKADFIAAADALCEASKAKLEPWRAKIDRLARTARDEEGADGTVSDATRRELAEALEAVVGFSEAHLARVQALATPIADAERLEAIVQKTEAADAEARAYAVALAGHEDAAAEAAAEKGNAETQDAAAMAMRYGFKTCFAAP